MKAKIAVIIVVTSVLAAAGGWFAARQWPANRSTAGSAGPTRKILYYQSAMHPWIKSDKPGKCTICGMDLVPVYEGQEGLNLAPGLVSLSSNSINVVNIQTEELKRRPLRHTLRVAGTIEEDDTRHRIISAYVDGRIDRLFVNYLGAEVTSNQPMAAIYSPMLLTAEREYVTLRSGRPAAPGSEQGRLAEAAAQRLRRFGMNDTQVESLPRKSETNLLTEILAPMSGTVVARGIYEGQYVKEGDRLFEIADFSTVWFRFDAYERDLPWLKVGQKIEVSSPAVPEKIFAAAISFIEPNLNDPTRSAKVRVEIQNPIVEQDGKKRRELYQRLYADGILQADTPEVLAVPRSAVLSPAGRPVVYVAKGGGAFEQRTVRLGRRGDEFWEVLEGVKPGEIVVTAGNLVIDAQAQLSQSGNGSGIPAPGSTLTDTTALSADQQTIASRFIALVDDAGSALAADNLADFNRAAQGVHATLPGLLDAFEPSESWHPALREIAESRHLEQATDLTAARKEFLALSQAASDLARELKKLAPFASLKIFQCPMLNAAIPGAPKTGYWIQRAGPLRNPFFGSRMIDCGTEIR